MRQHLGVWGETPAGAGQRPAAPRGGAGVARPPAPGGGGGAPRAPPPAAVRRGHLQNWEA